MKRQILMTTRMSNFLLLAFSLFLFLACRSNEEDLSKKAINEYKINKQIFETLKSMISEEKIDRLGRDNIGDYFEANGQWFTNDSSEVNLQLTEVLDKYSIPIERHEAYVSLLKEIDAYRVSKKTSENMEQSVTFWMFTIGTTLVNSTLINVVWMNSDPIEDADQKYIKIENNWYISVEK